MIHFFGAPPKVSISGFCLKKDYVIHGLCRGLRGSSIAARGRASREVEQRALLDEQSPGELRSPRDREVGAATSPAPTQDYSIYANMGADEMVALPLRCIIWLSICSCCRSAN